MNELQNSFEKVIGRTTFIVNIRQSCVAKKSLDEKFKDICKRSVFDDFNEIQRNLDENKKTS